MQFLANPKVSAEAREQIRANLGLDRPPLERYLQWLKNFCTGNLGTSFEHWPRPVMDILLERAPRTITLFLTGQLIAFVAAAYTSAAAYVVFAALDTDLLAGPSTLFVPMLCGFLGCQIDSVIGATWETRGRIGKLGNNFLSITLGPLIALGIALL